MSDIFSILEQLKELSYDFPDRYFLNTGISLDKIEIFEAAYGIEFPKTYKSFLIHFNGGMILEHDESYYIDMMDFEPDGPKASSFYFYRLDEMIEKYRNLRVDNWVLNDDLNGIYPILPVCRTPQGKIIFLISQKVLTYESPVFMASENDNGKSCVKIADDFNQFLNSYHSSGGFPDLNSNANKHSWQVFIKDQHLLKILSKPESNAQIIERTTAMLQLHPNDAWEYCARGNAYHYSGFINKALADFNNAIKIDQKEAFFYNCRGNLILNFGSARKALIDLDIALNLNPDDNMYRIGRADAFYKLGKYKKALADCNLVLEKDPKYELALDTRYKIYKAMGNDEKAKVDLELLNEIS